MSKRGLLVIAGLLALPGAAIAEQTDYSAGKSPAQLFSGDCAACHSSPRGLAKGKDQNTLANFLREHYTTRAQNAGALAAYLVGNPGPAPAPANSRQPRGTQASAPAATPAVPAAPRPAAAEEDPFKRMMRPFTGGGEPETPEGAIAAPEPGEAAAPDKQKGKPRTAARPSPDGAKPESGKPAAAEPAARSPRDAAKDTPKEPPKEAARPRRGDPAEAAKEAAAKAEETKEIAARDAAAKEAAAKADAAKAEAAAKVRSYATGGEPARVKDSEPPAERPAGTPPG